MTGLRQGWFADCARQMQVAACDEFPETEV